MTTYKQKVRSFIQPLLDAGMTQGEVATRLGLKHPNHVCQILGDHYPTQVLPIGRLPALCSLCGLTATESLRLVKSLVASATKKGMQLDVPTFEWLLRCTALALKEPRGAV